jgi:hypothetical protein
MVGPEREVAEMESSVDIMTRLRAGGLRNCFGFQAPKDLNRL